MEIAIINLKSIFQLTYLKFQFMKKVMDIKQIFKNTLTFQINKFKWIIKIMGYHIMKQKYARFSKSNHQVIHKEI